MNGRELSAAQAQAIADLKAATEGVGEPAQRAVQAIARDIRAEAARRGDRIGIRVLQRKDGVRLTVTGPAANKYRGAVQKAMESRAPAIKAEIRALLTRRP